MASSIALRLANEATASQAVAAARMAKYAHQPPNTRRMYVGYQKEWEVGPSPPFFFEICTPLSALAVKNGQEGD
jgi:hypothetical protein